MTQHFWGPTPCPTSDLMLACCQAICRADIVQMTSPILIPINFTELYVRLLLYEMYSELELHPGLTELITLFADITF